MKITTRNCLFFSLFLFAATRVAAQCNTTNITGDLIISSDQPLSGTYNITGLFQVDAGATVTVTPYSSNGCGELVINAAAIDIQGSVKADSAGFAGGAGGAGSTTGVNTTYLANCTDKDNCYNVSVNGGAAGTAGSGSGAGNIGAGGGPGSGPKQTCENVDDTYGLIGSGGGGAAGGGGSYGGNGSAGGNGGGGNASGSFSGISVSSCSTPIAGNAGNATNATGGTIYGSNTLADIDLGSGGAGAGGGGKSYNNGFGGDHGGTGGGKIMLVSTGTLNVAGTLSAQGSAGLSGGAGGAGGKTSKCCSDGCSGCDEVTYSCGGGGGGGAGGGSGGGIYMEATGDITLTGTVRVEGGNGGNGGAGGAGATPCNYGGNLVCGANSGATNAGATGALGGGGGGGRIKIVSNPCRNNVFTANLLLSGGNGNGGTAEAGILNYGTIGGIDAPTGDATATAATCAGTGDGSATVNVTGGLTPYTYQWNDANAQTTAVATGLIAGYYNITVTDANGCTFSTLAVVNSPAALSVTPIITHPCGGINNGAIALSVGGGTPAYSYAWTPGGQTTGSISGLGAGTYDLTLHDTHNCQATGSYTLTDNTITVTPTVANETCPGDNDGSITLTVTGASGNYTFLWNNTATTQDITGLAGGNYNVTVTDVGSGCTTTGSFTVQSGSNYTATITQDGDTLTASTGSSYQWYLNTVLIQGASSQTYVLTESGTYYCVIGDQACEFTSNSLEVTCICSEITGVSGNSLFETISVYPNPASQELNVVVNLDNDETATVTLIDLAGRKLWLKEEDVKGKTFKWKIPVDAFAAGNYFVLVKAGGQTRNVKVVIKD